MNCKFSVYGYGYYVKTYNGANELYRLVQKLPEEKLYESIFDPVKFQNISHKSSYLDYKPDESFCMYKTNHWSRLEITNGRKKYKINFVDLLGTNMLFNYTFVQMTDQKIWPNDSIIILEEDMGNFGNTLLTNEIFNIHKLEIIISQSQLLKEALIINIKYNNNTLHFKKSDTLNRGLSILRTN